MKKILARLSLCLVGCFALIILTAWLLLSNCFTCGDRTKNSGFVAITFDDGPDALTPEILKEFERFSPDSKATFFTFGSAAAKMPEMIKAIHEGGHEVANHDWRDLTSFVYAWKAPETFERNFGKTHQTIAQLTGEPPVLFRPGGGVYNKSLADILRRQKGYHPAPVLASHAPLDVFKSDWLNHLHRQWVLTALRDGAIIVLHQGESDTVNVGQRTLDFLPVLLKEMEARGLRSITVSQMIENNQRQ